MDLMAGLAAAQQAISIVKSIRELDQDFDLAVHKAQMAELYSVLADVKIALSDAKLEINQRDLKIIDLEDALNVANSGEQCPICEKGRMKTLSSKPHPSSLGRLGVKELTLKCQNDDCNHRDTRLYDPENRSGTN